MIELWMVKAAVVITVLFVVVALLGYAVQHAIREDEWPTL